MTPADCQRHGPAEGSDVPCKGMASYMLSLAKQLLIESCEQHDGILTAHRIENIFDKLLEAPGDLPKVYKWKFSKCSAALLQSPEGRGDLPDSFQNQLADIVGGATRTVSIGHLQTVGLKKIRSSLGDRWEALADRVVEIAEHCIARRLTAYDSFTRTQSNDFIICFAELSGEEAKFKARIIERDLTEMLLGQEENGTLQNFDLGAEQLDELANFSVESHEIEMTPADATSENLFDELLGKLGRAANQLHQDTDSILESLAQSGKVRPRLVLKLCGESTNTTLLGWDAESQSKSMQLKALCSNDAGILAKLDRITLLSGATYLCEQRISSVPILSIGVNYDTLNTRQFLSGYLDACRELANEIRKKIAFNIHIPRSHLHHYGVLDRISVLRPFCVALSIQIQEPGLEALDWEAAGLSMVVMAHRDFLARTGRHSTSMISFSDRLRVRGVRLLVDGVPPGAGMDLLRDHGVEFYATQNVMV